MSPPLRCSPAHGSKELFAANPLRHDSASLNLTATGGFESGALATLFLPARVLWSVGASAAVTVFGVGRRRAASDQAIAAYEQQIANYRETVLSAFEQLEDNLAALQILEQEAQTQARLWQLLKNTWNLQSFATKAVSPATWK
jgi:outer membrane protein TolC